MRKKCTALIVALTATAGVLAVSAAGASPLIEENIPGTNCGANAYKPSISDSTVSGSGLIDCNGSKYHLQIDSCIQESNTSNGTYSTVSGSCDLVPKSGSDYQAELASTPVTTERTSLWYRTWTWGWANGNTATVESDPIYSG